MATKATDKKTTISFDVLEPDFTGGEDDVNFFKVGDNIILNSKVDDKVLNIDQIIDTLDNLYSKASIGTYENDVLMVMSTLMNQIKNSLD